MSDQKNIANLFVVGAMRAGTTSFMEMLSLHPEVYVSPIKEPHYFANELPTELYEKRPLFSLERYFRNEFPKPIHRAHIKNEVHYNTLFSLAETEKYRGEGSVSYLHSPGAAARIYAYNPDSKIIVVTRNPLDRAYSHYRMDVGLLKEKRDFESLLSEQIAQYREGSLSWYQHLAMSFYQKPIKEYERHFKGQLLILSFEELINDSLGTLAKVSGFLDIGPFPEVNFPNRNESKTIKYEKPLSILKKLGIWQLLSSVLPSSFKRRTHGRIYEASNDEMKISEELYKELTSIFEVESFSRE